MISLVINLDTRKGLFDPTSTSDLMLQGARSVDFLIEGVRNKINFFKGHEVEVNLFIDVHEELPPDVFYTMNNMAHSLTLSKHREYFKESFYYPKWNDLNFLNAIMLSRGEYVAHFDGDMAAFINDPFVIDEWINWLNQEKYNYISYPSQWSPVAVADPDFSDYMWVSTRFFFCKKDMIQYDETVKCLSDSTYLYEKYGQKKRQCPWIEHILGIMTERDKIFYPPIQPSRFLIFAWNHYKRGLLQHLMDMSYDGVQNFVMQRGISYPCDVNGSY